MIISVGKSLSKVLARLLTRFDVKIGDEITLNDVRNVNVDEIMIRIDK